MLYKGVTNSDISAGCKICSGCEKAPCEFIEEVKEGIQFFKCISEKDCPFKIKYKDIFCCNCKNKTARGLKRL